MRNWCRADTELKAYLLTLAIYNEIKLRHPSKIKDPIMDFLIQVWDWKEGKGSYPKDFCLNGMIKADEFIRCYIEPAKDGIAAMRNVVNNYFYETVPLNWNLPASDLIHTELARITLKRGIEYGKWRATGPVLQPAPSGPGGGGANGNDNDGEGAGTETGTGTGNGNIPFTPNPHFQPWQ